MKIRSLTIPLTVLGVGIAMPIMAQSIEQIDPDQAPFPQTEQTDSTAPTVTDATTAEAVAHSATPVAAPPTESATTSLPPTDALPPKPSDPEELAAIKEATDTANRDMLTESARKDAAYEAELARVRAAEEQYKVDRAEFERKSAEQKALADEYEAQRKAWEAKYHKPVPR